MAKHLKDGITTEVLKPVLKSIKIIKLVERTRKVVQE